MKYKSKHPLFQEFNFVKECIYVNKATSLTFFTKFNYLNGTNIFQIVFGFITYSVVT